jgi:hypothetical protein
MNAKTPRPPREETPGKTKDTISTLASWRLLTWRSWRLGVQPSFFTPKTATPNPPGQRLYHLNVPFRVPRFADLPLSFRARRTARRQIPPRAVGHRYMHPHSLPRHLPGHLPRDDDRGSLCGGWWRRRRDRLMRFAPDQNGESREGHGDARCCDIAPTPATAPRHMPRPPLQLVVQRNGLQAWHAGAIVSDACARLRPSTGGAGEQAVISALHSHQSAGS